MAKRAEENTPNCTWKIWHRRR